MRKLVLSLKPNPRELPISFLSRLAARNGCDNLITFCKDVGLVWQNVDAAETHAINKLCELSGNQQNAFKNTIFRHTSNPAFTICNQTYDRYTFKRDEIRVCPACLREQHRLSPELWGKVHQFHWQIPQIQRCVVHSERLVSIEKNLSRNQPFDASLAIKNAWAQIAKISTIENADAFDIYLTNRVSKPSDMGLCDRLTIPALTRAAESLGTTLCYGSSQRSSKMERSDLRNAMVVGFELLLAGEGAMSKELLAFSKAVSNWRSPNRTPSFGELQRRLNRKDWLYNDLDPLREFMRRFVLVNFPVPAGSMVYGFKLETRRIHTITTAARETGLCKGVLEHLLLDRGVGHCRRDGKFILDAPLTKATVVELEEQGRRRFFTEDEAKKYLGASGRMFRLLKSNNVLHSRPVYQSGSARRYDKVELQELLDKLFADAEQIEEMSISFVPWSEATRAARCSALEIVQLIISGRLKTTIQSGKSRTMKNLLISKLELVQALPKQKRNGFTKTELKKRWSMDIATINRLVETGALRQKWLKNSHTRMSGMLVTAKSVEAYEREHRPIDKKH